MKKKLVLSILFIVSGTLFSENKKNGVGLGLGLGFQKGIYKKEKGKVETTYLPGVGIRYKNFYINDLEAGFDFDFDENLNVAIFANFQDGFSIKGKDMETGYKTLKNRKKQIAYGGTVSYLINGFESYLTVNGGKRGSYGTAGFAVYIPATEKLMLSVGTHYSIYSGKYANYYFGVDKEELGGKLINEYKPNSSTSYGFEIGGEYKFNDKFSTFAILSTEIYSKEIHKSPIVKNKAEVIGGLGIKYTIY